MRIWFWRMATALTLLVGSGMAADRVIDPDLIVLMADTHVTDAPTITHQREGLKRCIREILALNPRPANLLIYGDLAYDKGAVTDYRALRDMLTPLANAGIAWHACLGNHDRRAPFFEVFPEKRAETPLVVGRLVTLVELPHADFLMLDSCLEGPVNGGLDDAQRAWFNAWVTRSDKPLFVGAHHSIQETGIAGILAATPRCKAYLYGHHHRVADTTVQGVRTFCLPSTGHWGDIGYVLVRLTDREARFTLRQHDHYTPRPAATPDQVKPAWRERVARQDGMTWRVALQPKE